MLGHHSVPGPPVRSTRFVMGSGTAMELRLASRCGPNYLIVTKTIADARSSSSLWTRIKELAGLVIDRS